MKPVAIEVQGTKAGEILFLPGPPTATRSGDAFRMRLPFRLSLSSRTSHRPWVRDIRFTVSSALPEQPAIELGCGSDNRLYWDTAHHDAPLEIRGNLAALAEHGRARYGRAAQLVCQWSAQVLKCGSEGQIYGAQFVSKPVRVEYSVEHWVSMLRSIGAADAVLVAIPLAAATTPEWTSVWSSLVEARDNFVRGGPGAWKNTVRDLRRVLEKWRELEKSATAASWTVPKPNESAQWTKEERLAAVRWALMVTAHLGPHSDEPDWTRSDAQLLLAAVAGLLAHRQEDG